MPGKNNIKFINSLKQKKFRQEHQLFIVEGEKMVDELINSRFSIHSLYGTKTWIRKRGLTPGDEGIKSAALHEIKDHELERVSSLKTANQVLAIASMPAFILDKGELSSSLTLVLDKVQDPGNLGTLIRSADWFGVRNVILSNDSTEITNPKVVQSTMGSIFRIRYHYLDLPAFLKSVNPEGLPVIGAFLDGAGIYSAQLPGIGLLVLGNESRGISPEVERLVTQKITIPSHKTGRRAESLNIAVAGSIILSEFMRRGLS